MQQGSSCIHVVSAFSHVHNMQVWVSEWVDEWVNE